MIECHRLVSAFSTQEEKQKSFSCNNLQCIGYSTLFLRLNEQCKVFRTLWHLVLHGEMFHSWKNKQKLCSQQLNSSGGFIFLLRKNNKRQIPYILKSKCDFPSPPNPQSFAFLLRCGHKIVIFSNVHFLILLRIIISRKQDNSKN